jgi:catechol O-methyltransferase/protein arginine N-methyltransferase 5
VRPGTWVVADNVVYPGAPGFLEHLVPSNGYDTQLLEAAFEYEERWRPDWDGPHRDALSLSKFSGIPAPEEA